MTFIGATEFLAAKKLLFISKGKKQAFASAAHIECNLQHLDE